MRAHEADVRVSLGKFQPVLDMWYVAISKVRYEEHMFAPSSKYRLYVDSKDVRNVKLLIVSFTNNHRGSIKSWSNSGAWPWITGMKNWV
jgi:hypothetical protein